MLATNKDWIRDGYLAPLEYQKAKFNLAPIQSKIGLSVSRLNLAF
jgi:hypothetical protein